ncbi:MAG: uroporphyrinogen decarboxylase family protein [Ruminococcus sp.]|jgi:hypothetical protein
MKETMTAKERWLAALQMKPVDRIPVWAKLGSAYPKYQKEPFNNMTVSQLQKYVGGDRHEWIQPSGKLRFKNGAGIEKSNKNGDITITYITKYGTCINKKKIDPETESMHPVDMCIKTLEDIKIMTEWYDSSEFVFDKEANERAKAQYKECGQDAVVSEVVVETPFMYYLEYLAGIAQGHLLLADYQDEIEALFEAEDQWCQKRVQVAAEHSPADILYIEENTSTTTLSPAQFREYCVPDLKKYTQIMQEAGYPVAYHMCGHLKLLLADLAQLPNQAQEAFTPPPFGAATLTEGRAACPDKCFIGGCGAGQWVENDAEKIITYIESQFSRLPHHRGIVLTSAGVMPPGCSPDTIKEVFDWVKKYPNRN